MLFSAVLKYEMENISRVFSDSQHPVRDKKEICRIKRHFLSYILCDLEYILLVKSFHNNFSFDPRSSCSAALK